MKATKTNARVEIRITKEELEALKVKVKANGYKTVSQFTRHRWGSVDAESNTLKEIVRVRDLTVRTRQKIASLTGNINQLARMYNQGYHSSELVSWDRKNREELRPVLYELIDSNKQLISLCNKILGH